MPLWSIYISMIEMKALENKGCSVYENLAKHKQETQGGLNNLTFDVGWTSLDLHVPRLH